MTSSSYITIGGQPATRAVVVMPSAGVWWADVDCELAPNLGGALDLVVGTLTLRGTIDSARSGAFGERRRARVIGGAGAWGTALHARHYHNDAGVRARVVIEDAAREAGETVSIDADIGARVLGVDYVRESGPASRALRAAIGDAVWWVEPDGTTRVSAQRPTSTAVAGTYEVLEHNPRTRLVIVAADDLTAVGVGSVLSERLEEPQTVRELVIRADDEAVRLEARCGSVAGQSQLARELARIIEQVMSRRIHGRWRYRVVQISVDRLELQPVRRDAGLPDVLPISMWPGVAGAHAKPQLGAEVLVEFLEGDRTRPVVSGFAGKDGTGHAPDEQTFSVGTTLKLGGAGATNAVALAPNVNTRLNDLTAALNAFIAAVPVPNDGGAALQTAVKTAGGWSVAKASVDVAATKVRAL